MHQAGGRQCRSQGLVGQQSVLDVLDVEGAGDVVERLE